MGTALAEGPGQKGMAYSGGRPMFRMERQELSRVNMVHRLCLEVVHKKLQFHERNESKHTVSLC